MSDWVEESKRLLEQAQALHTQMIELHYELDEGIRAGTVSTPDLVDIGFFHRDMENTMREMRSDARKRKETASRLIAYRVAKESLADPSLTARAAGQYATCVPDAVVRPVMPKSDSLEYQVLLRSLGVPEEMIATKALTPHYEHLGEYLKVLSEQGRPMPRGLLDQKVEPSVSYRSKKR